MEDETICGVGGSYGNAEEHSMLARLIHEEIVQRHLQTQGEIVHLATYNVLFKRSILEQVNGFNETLLLGQDADLAYRIVQGGGNLAFEINSKVDHYHQTNLLPYLRKQAGQGYWRAWLYKDHPDRAKGDSYSGVLDHLQPLFGLLLFVSLLLLPISLFVAILLALTSFLSLLALQFPMTIRLLRRKGIAFATYPLMGIPRAMVRGVGFCVGLAQVTFSSDD
jgi:GT2 family glycosyltransferase